MTVEEKHLNNIRKILKNFIDKYRLVIYYLSIDQCCTYNTYSYFEFDCLHEMDKYTGAELKSIKSKLNKDIVDYLKENRIDKPVYFKSVSRGSGISQIRIWFENSAYIS